MEAVLLILVLGMSLVGLHAACWLAQWVLGRGVGSEAMQRISNAIK